MIKEILQVVAILLVYLFGYAIGIGKGIEIGKDNSFENVANEAVQTGKEIPEIAKKLQEDKDKLQKENDLFKEQLNQNEQ